MTNRPSDRYAKLQGVPVMEGNDLAAAITDLVHASTDDQIDDAVAAVYSALDPLISDPAMIETIANAITDGVIMA